MPSTHSEILCQATLDAKLTDAMEGTNLSAVLYLQAALSLTHGIGANQINVIAVDRDRHLTGPASFELDLATLAGFENAVDPLRNVVAIDNVVALFVRNQAKSTGNLLVGAATTNPWSAPFAGSTTAKLEIPPGGFVLLTAPTVAGYTITPTSKMLRLETISNSTDCDLVVFGRDT